MKRLLVLSLVVLAALSAFAQSGPASLSRVAGVYVSPQYAMWQGRVSTGVAAGAGTITVISGSVSLPDGRQIVPYATTASITIGVGSNAETVTPSTVSGCTLNGPLNSCLITATFSNAHGQGDLIISGTNGYQEAVNDAGTNGGGEVYFTATESLTLATGGTTTDSVNNMLPANSVIDGAVGIVTTAITGGTCSAWGIGDATAATRFTPTTIALTAGIKSTSVLPAFLGSAIASATTGSQQGLTAAKVRITCATGAPGAGAVKVKVWGHTFVAPAA